MFDQSVVFSMFGENFFSGTNQFNISGLGVSEDIQPITGVTIFSTPLNLVAGETYHFATSAGIGGVGFSTWTFTGATAAVPELASMWLLACGLIGLLGMTKKSSTLSA